MRFLWEPVMKALEERQTRIADGLAAAERGQHEQELAEQRAAEQLREAKEQAAEIISQAQRRGDELVEEAKDSARLEGERLLAAARADIDQERNQARESLRGEVAKIAVTAAEQLLRKEIDAGAHAEMLDRLASEL
jgi:F-type H+-transporting ATPase subunit b